MSASVIGHTLKLRILTRTRFRWTYLALENIARQNTPKQAQTALKTLPATLEDTYAEILLKIPEKDKSLAQMALLWLAFAKRPMTLAELNEAIILEDDMTDIDQDDRLCRKETTLQVCRGLIDCYAGIASLSHSSVKTFLLESKSIDMELAGHAFKDGDRILMAKCLHYLSMTPFRFGACENRRTFTERLERYPLLRYAAHSWALHASSFNLERSDLDSIMKFLQTWRLHSGGAHASWVQILQPNISSWKDKVWAHTQPLYYAASFGLRDLVKLILQEDKYVDVNARGGRNGSTPLFVACWREHFDVALLLLDAGANVSIIDPGVQMKPLELLSVCAEERPVGPRAAQRRELMQKIHLKAPNFERFGSRQVQPNQFTFSSFADPLAADLQFMVEIHPRIATYLDAELLSTSLGTQFALDDLDRFDICVRKISYPFILTMLG